MATLYDRLKGNPEFEHSGNLSERKIPIHAFCGLLNEVRRGKHASNFITIAFNLDTAQVNQMLALRDLFVACPNKEEFIRILKDCLYLAETGYDYLTQDDLLARLQEAVTDNGGTLP